MVFNFLKAFDDEQLKNCVYLPHAPNTDDTSNDGLLTLWCADGLVHYCLKISSQMKTEVGCFNQEQLKAILLFAASKGNSELVEALVSLTEQNRPGQQAVEEALKLAASKEDSKTVQVLISLTANHAPSKEAFDDALKSRAFDSVALDLIAMTGDNAPSQETILDRFICWNVDINFDIEESKLFLKAILKSGRQEVVDGLVSSAASNSRMKKTIESALWRLAIEDPKENLSLFNKCSEVDVPSKDDRDAIQAIKDKNHTVDLYKQSNCVQITELEQALKNLCYIMGDSDEARSSYRILKLVQLSINAGCDAQSYLSSQESKLSKNLKSLQSTSYVETAQNIAAAILSVLVCLTGVGLYFSLKIWDQNREHRGGQFRFFTDGAKQSAEIAEFQAKRSTKEWRGKKGD